MNKKKLDRIELGVGLVDGFLLGVRTYKYVEDTVEETDIVIYLFFFNIIITKIYY